MKMTIENIYNEYPRGSLGFVIAIETHCGFGISRSESQRIGDLAETAADFQTIWENDDSWTDDNNDPE